MNERQTECSLLQLPRDEQLPNEEKMNYFLTSSYDYHASYTHYCWQIYFILYFTPQKTHTSLFFKIRTH